MRGGVYTWAMPSIFSRIIANDLPGAFIFRSARWVAFLDVRPTSPGHALLVPVAEVALLSDLPGATTAELGQHLARLTTTIKRVTGCPAVNIVLNDGPLAGQEVPHCHFHLIPRWPDDGRGYRFAPQPGVELPALAARLAQAWESA